MKKTLFISILLCLICLQSRADEGMWLLNLLDKNTKNQMKQRGLKIDPKEIYNENDPSLHDAVVALDFGCTGSMISDNGLMITNHHCAYDDIHRYSTDEKNYLEYGFWAQNQSEEIPIEGKSVFFLRRVIDVTDDVLAHLDSCAKAGKPVSPMGMRRVSTIFEKKCNPDDNYEAMMISMWRGIKYFVFLYEQYEDVRLVAAPPSSIGAFGGETDNWSWPQHKGDFALYRVYGDKDGKPAKYSADNKPIKPVRFLKISTKGVKDNSYAMTLGYPYRTYRYIPSFGVTEKIEVENPPKHFVKRSLLDAMRPWMDADSTIRLKYSNKYFSLENVQGNTHGELKCLVRFDVAGKKAIEEAEMQKWIDADKTRKEEYGTLLKDLEESYKNTADIRKAKAYYRESIVSGSGFLSACNRYNGLVTSTRKKDTARILKPENEDVDQLIKLTVNSSYKNYDERVEKDLLPIVLRFYVNNVPNRFWGDNFSAYYNQFNGDVKAMADYVFANSIFRNEETFRNAFKEEIPFDKYAEDPAILIAKSTAITVFNEEEKKQLNGIDQNALRTKYAKALYAFRESKKQIQAPDANMTMRMSYGTVGDLTPSDGIHCLSQTTIQGYLDKADPTNYEFNVDPKMRQLIEKGDWGRWGENGILYVNFLSDNDITGGNSGSPVLNGKGELIGLAFDGNLESLASDSYYVPGYNKMVSVDIRFVLWVIEKYGEAQYLINEMTFAN